jgi:transcription initiation factor TFIID TATA-box-binding protein
MVDYTIENVIVTTEVKATLNLKKIAAALEGVEYDPSRFPGIVFKFSEPQTATFLLKSGKAVCTGGKSFKESRQAIEKIVQMIKDTGVTIKDEPDIDIKNIVVSLELHSKINLNEVAELYNWKNVT